MIGIIGAMQIEVDAILEYFDQYDEKEINGVKFYLSKYDDKDVILCLSGVGKVNASMTTTLLINEFKVDKIINIGTAGGMNPNQNTLDIVVAEKVYQYDFNTCAIDGDEGLGIESFCDDGLIKLAVNNPINDVKVWVGNIASGDTFVAEDEKTNYILNNFDNIIACEMESGAISQVCNRANVPCVVLRSLSDIVYKEESGMDFKEYASIASKNSAKIVINLISKI